MPLSIDTRKAEVMRRAAGAGARSSTTSRRCRTIPAALEVAAETGLPVVLMHAQGDPRTMQDDPRYDDVVLDVYDWLDARIAACERAGIPRARLVVDPGIGFGKTLAHNLALIGASSIFHGLGCAILLGASRKSFIARPRPGAGGDRLRRLHCRRAGSAPRKGCRSCASTTLRRPARPWRCGRRRLLGSIADFPPLDHGHNPLDGGQDSSLWDLQLV